MKRSVCICALSFLVSTCGAQDRKKNKDLREQNDALEARNQANEAAAKTASNKAEEAAAKAKDAEAKARDAEAKKQVADAAVAIAKRSQDQESARANAEAKRAAEAEAQKAAAQKALDAELAKPHEDLALRPYSGVWIAEQSVTGLAADCGILTVVSAKNETITRAVVCGNDTASSRIQLELFTPSDFAVRTDLFPSSLGLSVSAKLQSSTCGLRESLLAPAKEFVFDQSTQAAASRATYMFTTMGDGSKSIVSASGASTPAFQRQQTCESIQKLAQNPDTAKNTFIQVAALVCQGTAARVMTNGCFTASGFTEATSR